MLLATTIDITICDLHGNPIVSTHLKVDAVDADSIMEAVGERVYDVFAAKAPSPVPQTKTPSAASYTPS